MGRLLLRNSLPGPSAPAGGRLVFGDKALIQRCRLHKERNVADHLPEVERLWVLRKMRQAWKNPDAAEAERGLRDLAAKLERTNPDAAGSLREGLGEMFTALSPASGCGARCWPRSCRPTRWSR